MLNDLLAKIFGYKSDEHGTGAWTDVKDPRDVPATAFQEQAGADELPDEYITDISMLPILNQGRLGACVGHAIAYAIMMFEWLESKKIIKVSPRFLYGLAKQRDGRPDDEGTYPRVVAGIVVNEGAATEDTLPNDTSLSHAEYTQFPVTEKILNDAKPRKIKGYISIDSTLSGVRNGIKNNKFVTASMLYGDWKKSPVQPAEGKGRHYIFIYGWTRVSGGWRFYFVNSWGKLWNSTGKGYFLWADHEAGIRDIYAYTDIPNAILEEYKAKWPYKNFTPAEVKGLDLKLVDKLQAIRDKVGFAIKIISGFRTEDKNEQVGGVKDSAHMKGLAVDILCAGSRERFLLKKAAFEVGFRRIGDGQERKFLHLDIDPSKDQDVEWYY